MYLGTLVLLLSSYQLFGGVVFLLWEFVFVGGTSKIWELNLPTQMTGWKANIISLQDWVHRQAFPLSVHTCDPKHRDFTHFNMGMFIQFL